MSFSEMLNHRCNIYHIIKSIASPGYNLPSSVAYSYPDVPDQANVPCHFHVKNAGVIIQTEPSANYEAKIKLSLPACTDIRLNDKVIDCESGYEYTAEIPRKVRRHHVIVWLHRDSVQARL